MIDMEKLATLRAVVLNGSFSGAARELNLTQPAVSRQVSLLERRLGISLVRRTQRGVSATEAGALLCEHTGTMLTMLARAEAEVRDLAGLHRGSVRLGSFFTALVYLSAEVAAALGERHPGLRIVDELVGRQDALTGLAGGSLDVAIVFEHDFEPAERPCGIRIFPLYDDPVRVLLPAGHPLADRPSIRVQDLAGETWIRPFDGAPARLIDMLARASEPEPRFLAAGHGEEPVETQALVVSGRGISIAHELNVLIEPEKIVVRPLAGPRRVRHIQAATLDGNDSPVVRATLQALRRVGGRRRQTTALP